MKPIIVFLLLIVSSCYNSSKPKSEEAKAGDTKIVGLYIKPDSTREVTFLFRRITKVIKYDSALKKDFIIVDTLVGVPFFVLYKNISGKDSISQFPEYRLISKDSISWRVENIPLDTLLDKHRPINKPYIQ